MLCIIQSLFKHDTNIRKNIYHINSWKSINVYALYILVAFIDTHLSSSSARVTDGLSNHFIDLQLFGNTKVFLVKLEQH